MTRFRYDRECFVKAEDGTLIFYGVRGRGPVIVLNDGIGCDGFVWKYLLPHLSLQHKVIHWNYRAHGRSGSPRDPQCIDVPTHASDLRHVLDQEGADKALIFGHSMGTQVALESYRRYPERLAGLVLICGTYGKTTSTFHGTDLLEQVLPKLVKLVDNNRGFARALWGRLPPRLAFRFAQLSGEIDGVSIREADFRPYFEHIAIMDPSVFLSMVRMAGEHNAEEVLGKVEVPTLVIAAERDTFTPASLSTYMAENIPGSDFLMLKGASHAAPIEQPVTLEIKIDAFLQSRTTDYGRRAKT